MLMEWLDIVIPTLVTLTVTFTFNYLVGVPKKIREYKKMIKAEKEYINERLEALEDITLSCPMYRSRIEEIQTHVEKKEIELLDICRKIKANVDANGKMLDERLKNLERREKNALRAKILEEYRLYTDEEKNSMCAWSEMEHHSFFKLIEDYESLGGNDYVHDTILPEMNELDVIKMSDFEGLKRLYEGRKMSK